MDQIRLMVRDAVRDVIQEGSAAAVVSSTPTSASSVGAPAAVPAVACAGPQADVPIPVNSSGPHAGILPVGNDGTVPNVPLAAVLTPEAGDFSVSVSASLRLKIIEHKFVNLSQLLSDSDSPPPTNDTFSVVEGRIQVPVVPKKIFTFSAWCTAFLRYAGIYLSAHPGDAYGMLNHMRHVSYLHGKGLGYAWREFDRQFRRARELDTAHHKWGVMQSSSSMWLNAIASGAGLRGGSAAVPNAATGSRPGGPRAAFRNVCFAFNEGSCRRTACPFRHVCRSCGGIHSWHQCFQRRPARPQSVPKKSAAKRRAQ